MKRVSVMVPAHRVSEITSLAEKIREEERSKNDDVSVTGAPGHDAKAISRIAREVFGGYREMFVHHGWPERGSNMMRKVQTRVAETYGSVAEFDSQFPAS